MTRSLRSRQHARVVQAPHVLGLEVGRLLVDEQDQADAPGRLALKVGEQAREFDHGRRAAGIVVRARAAQHAVVVGADHDGFGIMRAGSGSMVASMLRTGVPATVEHLAARPHSRSDSSVSSM